MKCTLCFALGNLFLKKGREGLQHIIFIGIFLFFSGFVFADTDPVLVSKDNIKKENRQGGTLIRSLKYRPKTITPYVSMSKASSKIQSYIFESLLRENNITGEWEGVLAKEWKVSSDGLTYTFVLHENIVFSDGEPLKALDVVFTYNFLMNKSIKNSASSYLKRLESVTSINPYTVVFKYKEPYFQSLRLIASFPILPKHFYAKYLSKPKDFNESKGLLLGSGAYKLSKGTTWTSDSSSIEFSRNNRYWGENKATLDKLVWKVINNDSARLVAYRNGEIDTYEANPKIFKQLKQDKNMLASSKLYEYMEPKQGYTYIAWNPLYKDKETFFNDRRVRLAMTYLTNRETIVEQVYSGYAESVVSPFRKESKQHDPLVTGYKYSLEKAKMLLKQAGFEDRNKDGVIEDKNGKDFSFKFSYASGRNDSQKVAFLLRDAYAKAGILVKLDPQESAVLYEMMDNRSFQALTSGWGGGLEMDIYTIFHSSQIAEKNNFISYKNKELDDLIDKTRITIDENKRMKLWQRAENILNNDQPYTFLVRRKSLLFVSNRFKNVKITQAGINLDLVPLKVYVSKELRKY